jgi:hypothetical protein
MKITLQVEEKDGVKYEVTTNLFLPLASQWSILLSSLLRVPSKRATSCRWLLMITSKVWFRLTSWRTNRQTLRKGQLPPQSLRVSRRDWFLASQHSIRYTRAAHRRGRA